MSKEKFIKAIETTFFNNLQKHIENHELIGTELESIVILESLNKSNEECKTFMLERIGTVGAFSDEDSINEILKTAYTNVYNQVFENEVEEEPKSFKSLFVGTIRLYQKDKEDSSLDMFQIIPVAGKHPNALFMFREEAEDSDFELDKSYLISCETPYDYPNDISEKFSFQPIKEMTAKEVISAVDKLGYATMVEI